MLLLFPPGWSLNCGGPHLALPLLKGYLVGRGVPCTIRDLNLESSAYLATGITSAEVNLLSRSGDHDLSWASYFNVVDIYAGVARAFGGTWDVRTGFTFNECDLASSQSIRKFSHHQSPFTQFYTEKVIPTLPSDPQSIVGISATLPHQLLSSFELARLIRRSGYEGRLVLGGNAVTRLQDDLQQNWIFDLFDGVILNQGEAALEALARNRAMAEIPNLLWRQRGRFVYNGYSKLEPEDFSMPDFSGFPVGSYWGENYLPAISSRGCYYGKCSFCAIPFAWGNGGFLGFDDPARVAEYMIAASERWNIDNFAFSDESMNPRNLERISHDLMLSDRRVRFTCYARFERGWRDPSFLKRARNAGLRKINLGLESIGRDRSKLNKSDNADAIEDYLQSLHDHGIKVHLFVMVGFPGILADDTKRTLEFILEHQDKIDTVDVSQFQWARHTTHAGISAIRELDQDWALSYEYRANDRDCRGSDETLRMARDFEMAAISNVPRWTDPIYRLASPWSTESTLPSVSDSVTVSACRTG